MNQKVSILQSRSLISLAFDTLEGGSKKPSASEKLRDILQSFVTSLDMLMTDLSKEKTSEDKEEDTEPDQKAGPSKQS